MKAFNTFLLSLIVCFSSPVKSGIEDTIYHIEQRLARGESVAILYIDMQTKFIRAFNESEFARVIEGQLRLIKHFAGRENVHLIDVNYKDQGPTLSEALMQLRKNINYRLFVKDKDSAFQTMRTIPASDDQPVPADQVRGKLIDYLHSINTREIMLTGCFDGACVQRTAKDALDAGFNVSVDRDLNIIENLYSSNRRLYTPEEHARIRSQRWELIQKQFPNLKMVQPIEHDYCVVD
ncbi:isochorismatase family protein [Endozoicomonas arenosclerae]|uniref:isochorismatase family protein n=1 Tax=Endozoicomonas arenosclerae TaxID=1633495 RepID=UPI000782F7BF|nr:isochorismatase family protein [Endozoicomonas arenosclerae]